MKEHDFDEWVSRVGTDSYKWDYEGNGGSCIPLGVADTDYRIPREAVEAMRKVLDHGIFGYGHFPQERFASAVRGWYLRRHDVKLEKEWICHAPGLMTGALWIILQAYTKPGDKVVVQSPVYNTFHKVIEKQGRHVINNELILEDGKYRIDFEDLEQKASDPAVRILLLCSPHNPVGRVWTYEELLRYASIAKKTNTLIVSDEIHSDIVYENHKYTTFYKLPDEYTEYAIVMGSPSKAFNVAALYTSYVLIKNKALREQFEVVSSQFHLDYNIFGIEAFVACYNYCDYYVDQQREYLWGNISVVRSFLAEKLPNVKMIEPEGTYLLWLDLRELGLEQEELLHIFEKAKVKVNNGENYGGSGKGFVRMNVATQKNVLTEALERIARVMYGEGYYA